MDQPPVVYTPHCGLHPAVGYLLTSVCVCRGGRTWLRSANSYSSSEESERKPLLLSDLRRVRMISISVIYLAPVWFHCRARELSLCHCIKHHFLSSLLVLNAQACVYS